MKKNTTVGLVSLGCAKNLVDSENLLGMLRDRGYTIVADPAEAEIIFVNTCGFIEDAKQESIDAILEMAEAKREDAKLIVTGCLVQRYEEALKTDMPEIDVLMGVSPRGTLAFLRCVKAYAYLQGRKFVTPDDVKALAVPVLAHRIVMGYGRTGESREFVKRIVEYTVVPTEEYSR